MNRFLRPSRRADDALAELYAVAKLHVEGWHGNKIAARLRVAPATVAKRLKEAREAHLLKELLATGPEYEKVKSRVESLLFHIDTGAGVSFRDWLRSLQVPHPTLRKVTIVSSPWTDVPDGAALGAKDWRERLQSFAAGVGPYVEEELQRSACLGVSWGVTLAAVVRNVSAQASWRARRLRLVCIPTTGERESDYGAEFSSSLLARDLARSVFSGKTEALRLSSIPAFIPMAFTSGEVKTIKKLIVRYEGYRRIFLGRSGQQPALELLDTVLTSCGVLDAPGHFWGAELTSALGVSAADLHEMCRADIGGVLLPRENLDLARRREFDDLLARWTGITFTRLQDLARLAETNDKKPGILLVAAGRNKATAVLECVRCRVVNHLLIDINLAKAIFESWQAGNWGTTTEQVVSGVRKAPSSGRRRQR